MTLIYLKMMRSFNKRSFTTMLKVLFLMVILQSVAYSNNDKDVALNQALEEVSQGEELYIRCIACHSPSYHRTGPKHCGIFGKLAGSDPDFTFTDAMKNSGITWNAKTLDEFLKNPLKKIPGTSMGFSGIASAQERKQLIAFLKSLNLDNEKCE